MHNYAVRSDMLVGLSNTMIYVFRNTEDGISNDESSQDLGIDSRVIDTDEDPKEIEGWWMRVRSEVSNTWITDLCG